MSPPRLFLSIRVLYLPWNGKNHVAFLEFSVRTNFEQTNIYTFIYIDLSSKLLVRQNTGENRAHYSDSYTYTLQPEPYLTRWISFIYTVRRLLFIRSKSRFIIYFAN